MLSARLATRQVKVNPIVHSDRDTYYRRPN